VLASSTSLHPRVGLAVPQRDRLFQLEPDEPKLADYAQLQQVSQEGGGKKMGLLVCVVGVFACVFARAHVQLNVRV